MPVFVGDWTRAILLFLTLAAISGCDLKNDGVSVRKFPNPAGAVGSLPHLSLTADGVPVLSWVVQETNQATLKYAVLGASGTWQSPQQVATGTDWFTNWADFPSVVPISHTDWAAHWLVKSSAKSYAYDIAMSLSTDAGKTWGAAFIPHSQLSRGEHGFVSLFPWHQGVGVVWLDEREKTAGGIRGMALRSAVFPTDISTKAGEPANGGSTEDAASFRQVADDLVCDCCQTDVAITAQGPVVAYRNRTSDEIRDVYVVPADPFSAAGWQRARRVHKDDWQIDGCPVNGPAIAAVGNTVGVVWYTEGTNTPEIKAKFSLDGLQSFKAVVSVEQDQALGRTDIVMLNETQAVVSWMRRKAGDREHAEIMVQRVSTNGEMGKRIKLAETSSRRLSSFPQMVKWQQSLVFAWTETDTTNSRLITASVALSDLVVN